MAILHAGFESGPHHHHGGLGQLVVVGLRLVGLLRSQERSTGRDDLDDVRDRHPVTPYYHS